jgi:hypothetical protein
VCSEREILTAGAAAELDIYPKLSLASRRIDLQKIEAAQAAQLVEE